MNTAEQEINNDIYYINATWRIAKDKLNYILQKKYDQKKENKGKKELWKTCGYYQTVAQLYHALIEIGIRESALTSVKELRDGVQELHALIEKRALEGQR